MPMTEFFTHTPNYEISTGIPNSEEGFFWVFWGFTRLIWKLQESSQCLALRTGFYSQAL
jgi:hypothetical protein